MRQLIRTQKITAAILSLFRHNWEGQAIRNVAVYTSRLCPSTGLQLNFFEPAKTQLKRVKADHVVDTIRDRFGFTRLVYANSLQKGGTAIDKALLVGGHNGGNAYE